MKKKVQTGKAYQVFSRNLDGYYWIGESDTLKGARIIASRNGWFDGFRLRKPNIYRLGCLSYDANHYDAWNRLCPYYPAHHPYESSITADEYLAYSKD